MRIEQLRKCMEDYPTLYKEALEKLISETSEEFVLRYLCRCVVLQNSRFTKKREPCFTWSAPIRRALDHYVTTQEAEPTLAQLKKMPKIPLLFLRKYGEKYLEKLQRKCEVAHWTVACDRAISFLEDYNLTLRDVCFEVHYRGWQGGGAEIYRLLVSKEFAICANPKCLYIVKKKKERI